MKVLLLDLRRIQGRMAHIQQYLQSKIQAAQLSRVHTGQIVIALLGRMNMWRPLVFITGAALRNALEKQTHRTIEIL